MADSTRYREIQFVGGRVLQAREMLALQALAAGTDSSGNRIVLDLDALYREGATLNVTASVTSGTRTVTLQATNNAYPMYVFVRGRWETLRTNEAPAVTLASNQAVLYLNWLLNQVTAAQDASLVDSSTGQPAANMGQLVMSVSATDTSNQSLPAGAIAQNTSPILLFQFSPGTTTANPVTVDNVNPYALGDNAHAGLVKLSTSGAGGVAVGTNDPRLSDSRAPAAGSVVDASVRTPVSTGTSNTDGTAQYDLTSDPGGISAAKIVWQQYRQTIADYLGTVRTSIAGILSTLAAHIGAPLGQGNTHPMPTAAQVGATPISHINMPLNVPGSHPATVNNDTGGFILNQDSGFNSVASPLTPDLSTYAFGVVENGDPKSGLLHNGDVVSKLITGLVASPGGSPLNFTGQLTGLMALAQVVVDHVNQNSHANPHGLTLADIGALALDLTTSSTTNMNYIILRFAPNGNNPIELALGTGVVSHGQQISLPNNNFAYSRAWYHTSFQSLNGGGRTVNNMACNYNTSNGTVTCQTSDNNGSATSGSANVIGFAWRLNASS